MARPFIWITKGGHDAKSTKRDILYIQYQRGAPLKRGVNVKVGASQGLGGYTLMPLTRLPSRAQSPTGRLATQKIQWGEGRRQAPSSSVLCLSGHVHTHSSKLRRIGSTGFEDIVAPLNITKAHVNTTEHGPQSH
eukprot:Blabericola_migrator_1__11600@NODE_696_length_6829_cov_299_117421_g505_i0_p4_GENE_NODE_696_length_6829_cov_299_117421_g505_i0NODE_696_length_6829_cov_299_117421_g505_i0_p4_ORF_typecomplete_len135_score9_05_NODE_696_length_6829_cov_299_117421_g505_i029993403